MNQNKRTRQQVINDISTTLARLKESLSKFDYEDIMVADLILSEDSLRELYGENNYKKARSNYFAVREL